MLALLLLLLLGTWLALWWFYPERLVVTTKEFPIAGTVGKKVDLRVEKIGLFGWRRDVTGKVAATVADPAVADFDNAAGAIGLKGEGKTTIAFQMSRLWRRPLETKIDLEAIPPDENDHGPVTQLVILSDQGPMVHFPVGAEFGGSPADLRVEAHYSDGYVGLVTKKATLRTPEPPQNAFLTAANGRLKGIRPGKTSVSAEFEGAKTDKDKSLGAEVTANVDADEIRIAPATATLLPNETLPLRAEGYKGGKSIGDLTGLGAITWQSSDSTTARVDGSALTAVKIGQARVTAKLGAITSKVADVNVVDSIADELKIEPRHLHLRVGESARIGPDLAVLRGDADVSPVCALTSLRPEVVRYDPNTRTLVGVAPGTAQVAVTLGNKLVSLPVVVASTLGPIAGEVRVEPAVTILAPGQAEPLRVWVGDVDRTGSAALASSDPKVIVIQGDRACAVGPGNAEITATVSGADKPGKAYVTVNNEEITELLADPMHLSVGDSQRMPIVGRAACGIHEMFPQQELKFTVGGPNPQAVRLDGFNDVHGLAEGQANVDLSWRGKANWHVPVTVTNDPWADLRLEPANAVVHPGESFRYEVTAMKGGQRRVVGADQGVQLAVSDANTAQVIAGLEVGANREGQTAVIARLGDLKPAQANLEVTAGEAVAVGGTRYIAGVDGGGALVYQPRGTIIDNGVARYIGPGVVGVGSGTIVEHPAGTVVKGLRFSPDKLITSTNAQASVVRVIEVLSDGHDGNDVTADPKLQISEPEPGEIAKVDMTGNGPVFKGLKPGETQVSAKLGDLTSVAPLLIDVGGDALPATGRLVVAPDPLALWSGETTRLGSVRMDPGDGQPLIPVEYKVSLPEGQGVASLDGEQVKALTNGTTQLTVTATDPKLGGLSTTVPVQVMAADSLTVQPPDINLQVNETTPLITATGKAPDGTTYQAPAMLESQDQNVLVADPTAPGHFQAKAPGRTQLKATYRGRDAFATVTVSGKRFADVKTTTPNADKNGFDVGIEVLAAGSEGELEYRVYSAGETPKDEWKKNELQGDSRQVTLQSPHVPFGPRGATYHLMLEARDTATKTVQQYPLIFTETVTVQREENK